MGYCLNMQKKLDSQNEAVLACRVVNWLDQLAITVLGARPPVTQKGVHK